MKENWVKDTNNELLKNEPKCQISHSDDRDIVTVWPKFCTTIGVYHHANAV
jgi:hypothetical protein